MSKKNQDVAGAVTEATPPASPTPARKRSNAGAKRVVKLEKKLAAVTRRQAKLLQRIAAAAASADGRRALGQSASPADPSTGSSATGGGSPVIGYCLRDKMRVEIGEPEQITLKSGRSAITGTCPTCGGKVLRMGGASAGR
jgi:hypothetical protein